MDYAPSLSVTQSVAREKSVSFVVTGFGRFRGVSNNPTTVLVTELKEHLKRQQGSDLASIITTQVFETSAECVKRDLNGLYDIICSSSQENRVVVFLHLGVNYMGEQFQIEKCAYNDATFRVPDEQGFKPLNECILKEVSLGTCYETNLDVQDLCEQLNKTTSTGVSTVVSSDPGRFVCNYTYCYSLSKTLSHNETRALQGTKCQPITTLFIHVPPFDVAPKEEQLEFVTNAIKLIYEQVKPPGR